MGPLLTTTEAQNGGKYEFVDEVKAPGNDYKNFAWPAEQVQRGQGNALMSRASAAFCCRLVVDLLSTCCRLVVDLLSTSRAADNNASPVALPLPLLC